MSCRPDFAILVYPWRLTAKGALAADIRISKETPPTFLAHAGDDWIAQADDSVLMYLALKKARVPAELHVYASGGHGFGLRPSARPCSTWPQRCAEWLRAQGFLGLPNPFYAMDTCTKRPYPRNDIPPAEQLELLKGLGYAGIAWTEEPPEQVRAVAAEARKRGLEVFAIYCAAQVTPDGDLRYGLQLPEIMKALKGHKAVVWLHLGGKGPAFDALTGKEPAVKKLRALADVAAANGLRVAVYPHVGEWTARFGDATRLARVVDHPQFGVTFNLCHCLAMGDEKRIPKLLEGAKQVLFAVTINGADADVGRPDWRRLIQTLDRGTFEVAALLRQLRALGYTGPIGLQGYGIGGDRRENLAASMAAWRKLARAVAK